MKHYLVLMIALILWSCNNRRIVELPEISSSGISEVTDVSPAYIFYDETEKDSVLFNRKNLIGTTNWLVNADKRLKLKQLLPPLQYLQNKRRKKGMHSNEKARNYFTCNNLSQQTLGFIDFTATNFYGNEALNGPKTHAQLYLYIDEMEVYTLVVKGEPNMLSTRDALKKLLVEQLAKNEDIRSCELYFEENLTFQDYISIKELLMDLRENHQLQMKDDYFVNLNLLN